MYLFWNVLLLNPKSFSWPRTYRFCFMHGATVAIVITVNTLLDQRFLIGYLILQLTVLPLALQIIAF